MLRKLSESIPPVGKLVWAHRRWIPNHVGNDGSERTEWRLARRVSERPPVTDKPPYEDCFWRDYEGGGSFSDVTVDGWTPILNPDGEVF